MATAVRAIADMTGRGKRSERRFLVNQPAHLSLPEIPLEKWRAQIRDISRRGMQLVMEQPLPEAMAVEIAWNGRQIHGVIRYRKQRGEEHFLGVELTTAPDTLPCEMLAHYAGELEASQEALRKTNKELDATVALAREASHTKSRFLANVSHELRTPLNGIIGFTQLLYEEGVGPLSTDQKDCLADVLNCSRHLLTLINHVLDIAKIEAGKMEFHYQPVALQGLMRDAIESVRTLAAAKKILVHLHVDPRITAVEADPPRLRQVVLNYLSNALKFTPPEGTVYVAVRSEGSGQYRIEVRDTGPGIRAGDLPRLFSEFGQLNSSGKAHDGTGLGLAITKRIVEAQGGRVGVESTYGEGSRFYAVLPSTRIA